MREIQSIFIEYVHAMMLVKIHTIHTIHAMHTNVYNAYNKDNTYNTCNAYTGVPDTPLRRHATAGRCHHNECHHRH